MKLHFPKSLPFISAVFGLGASAAYYLSIVISQFFIGRPSSTWILGVFYVPILILKPGIIALLGCLVLRLILSRFYEQREISTHSIKILKSIFITVIVCSALAGTWKIYQLNEWGKFKGNATYNKYKREMLNTAFN